MTRRDTLTLGEFRELTKDMDDQVAILIVSELAHNEALAVDTYAFETSLDRQGVFLLQPKTSESVKFTDG